LKPPSPTFLLQLGLLHSLHGQLEAAYLLLLLLLLLRRGRRCVFDSRSMASFEVLATHGVYNVLEILPFSFSHFAVLALFNESLQGVLLVMCL